MIKEHMNFKKASTLISIALFISFTAWWIWLELFKSPEDAARDGFSISYGFIAGWGGIIGLIISKKWSGFKSYVGRSLIFFSIGLLCQFLGQAAYSIQFMLDHIENAYPSWGEIFFFISMPSYILAVIYIAKASGSEFSLNSWFNKVGALFFPIVMVIISYFMFIAGTSFEGMSWLAMFLAFAYPIGQAIFVSLALVAYYLAGKFLGGIMKMRVVFILFSLVLQYVADSFFIYKTINGTWYHADLSEYMFALSYAIMTFAFLQFLTVFDQIKPIQKQ
jgi:hypothetical protein